MSSTPTDNFEVFGEYVLLKQLAAGGMAEVFLARPTNPNANGRVVVVKRILKQIANDPVFIKMFRSEIRVSLGFNHPHTIQLHDFGEIDYQPYIAMEYIEGKSLKQIMEKFAEKGEVIPVPTALGLIAQATSGLGYAHHFENTVTGEVVNAVHRDISPHNLLVSYDGNLKVIDFGIAKAKNEITEKTRAGQIKGKCAYLSPEQLKEEVLDGRSDIFSLGIVAWELLTGHRLFHKQGDTELQIIQRIQNCERHIVPPSHVNSEVPAEVDEVVMKALSKRREDRYPTAEAFQSAIRKVMHHLYPNYTYADTAQIMRVLFETDMILERMALRDANDRAQDILSAELNDQTRIVEQKKGFFSIFSKRKTLLPSEIELRVGGIEAALKQRAKGSHYALAAFYVLSIFAIKIDDHYSLLDRYFLPPEAITSANASLGTLEKGVSAPAQAAPQHQQNLAPSVAKQELALPPAPIAEAETQAESAPEQKVALPQQRVRAAPVVRTAPTVARPVVRTVTPRTKTYGTQQRVSAAVATRGRPVASKTRTALANKTQISASKGRAPASVTAKANAVKTKKGTSSFRSGTKVSGN